MTAQCALRNPWPAMVLCLAFAPPGAWRVASRKGTLAVQVIRVVVIGHFGTTLFLDRMWSFHGVAELLVDAVLSH